MGLFSSIIESISNVIDSSINFMGNVVDSIRPHDTIGTSIDRPYTGTDESAYDYEFDNMIDDYISWFDEIDS